MKPINSMKLFTISFLIFSLLSCKQNDTEKINAVLESYKNAINNKDYDIIQPYLSNDFQVNGTDRGASLVAFYSYINFKLSERIKNITLVKWSKSNDKIFIIEVEQTFENNKKLSLVINCKADNGKLKICRMNAFLPPDFSFSTKASFANEEVFGNNRAENIKKLTILDKSSADSCLGKSFVVYFNSSKLKNDAITALNLLERFDSKLTNKYGFRKIEHQNLFLVLTNSKNTCTVGKNAEIPWIFPFPWNLSFSEKDSINSINLINKIGNTFSHEIIEGSLSQKYMLSDYTFRWFREGLSEYLAYKYCLEIAPKEAQQYFIVNRLSDAIKFKKNGNLLDWRGDTPIPEIDKGKLFGDRFIYFNEVGQYGRMFKLFKDLFDNHEDFIPEILKKIESTKNIEIPQLLRIMNEVTGRDIEELIKEY